MGLFTPELYRNFAIGFALGAAIVVWQIAPNMADTLVPQAHAATTDASAE
ncbi:hypothetical protein [Tsuneonella sp. SYSU-LHT278]